MQYYYLRKNSDLVGALHNFITIIQLVEVYPMLLTQLIPAKPDIVGQVNSSKVGAGGIWYSMSNQFQKFV